MRTRIEIKGGERMEQTLKAFAAKVSEQGVLRVGFLEGATYPEQEGGESVAQVAFWDEWGTSTSPARPFFRSMIEAQSDKWGAVLAANMERTGYDVPRSLARLGVVIKDQLTQSIVDFSDPPNAPSTIARKGFNKPLIDTGVMQRATDFEVGKQ